MRRGLLASQDEAAGGSQDSEPTCVGVKRLLGWVSTIDQWIAGEKKKNPQFECEHVYGLIATRTNKETGKREVLMCHGNYTDNEKEGQPKPFIQFPGGKGQVGEHPVTALHRELNEEAKITSDQLPPTLTYRGVYLQQNKRFAVHSFVYEDCPWDADVLTANAGSDTSRFFWTSEPFNHEFPPTEQGERVLRQLGFTGKRSANTPDDSYNGNLLREIAVEGQELHLMTDAELKEYRSNLNEFIYQSITYGAPGGIDAENREEAKKQLAAVNAELRERGFIV